MDLSEIVDVLENCELFSGLNRDEIEKIATLGHVEMYEVGENILNQGDFGEELYIIAEGHVFLERAIDVGTRKGSAIITILGRGKALGSWSTLIGETHTLGSSAVCRKPTKVIVIKGPALREMMLDNFQLGFKVLERLCFILRNRIRGAYGAMENI
ncbi:MAG: Crp/Fnr family transcriptional regulator [Deltaproteobacteria bacterium]|jgi:CRP-like cAMP-binding protein|nr:MAG: Crp/Fnr family transcriptional regulator [Deltaproteobacteria bacterium]